MNAQFVAVAAAVAFAIVPRPAHACSCSEIESIPASALDAFDVIFTGEVTEVTTLTSPENCGAAAVDQVVVGYRFVVSSVWKGDVSIDQVAIEPATSCAADFRVGDEPLVVAKTGTSGVAEIGNAACTALPSIDELEREFGAPTAPTEGSAGLPCVGACASAAGSDAFVLFLPGALLVSVRRRAARAASTD